MNDCGPCLGTLHYKHIISFVSALILGLHSPNLLCGRHSFVLLDAWMMSSLVNANGSQIVDLNRGYSTYAWYP
jgi:hypothetical protein